MRRYAPRVSAIIGTSVRLGRNAHLGGGELQHEVSRRDEARLDPGHDRAIGERDGDVKAWVHCDPEAVLARACAFDKARPQGALGGVPVGFKDVIDTADMPTGYNSAIYRDYRPRTDAACVALVRRAGGIVLGKTVTTEFASRHPGATRNPHNLAHSPGGSSSGSAAAVADFMVPLAFGTQTGGSTIRPSSYCGIVGYKPSFGTINRAGLKRVFERRNWMWQVVLYAR